MLEALQSARDAAARLLGVAVPNGWPEHPAAIDFTLLALRHHPEHAQWYMYVFVDPEIGSVVGSGGYKGPPLDGEIEIGYEVAPGFRGQGYATAAARPLVDQIRDMDRGVERVVAHTLAVENASGSVLRKVGFQRTGTGTDPDEGTVWRWELLLPRLSAA